MKKRRISLEEERRNWVDLPHDIMILIFSKLGAIDILCYAQFVCSSWQQLAKEPQVFQCIFLPNDIYGFTEAFEHEDTQIAGDIQIMKAAVDRSRGRLTKISIGESWCTDTFLNYLVLDSKAKSLKSLRLATCARITENELFEVCEKLPLLEELELGNATPISQPEQFIKKVGRCCSHLKYFEFNHRGSLVDPESYYNKVAFTIAENMPQLRGLRLFLTKLTNKGFRAILHGCANLEDLVIRDSFYTDLKVDLRKEMCR
ncbi:hypothetical protein ACHQM5_001070 [Ranunculus cassubicifolius]